MQFKFPFFFCFLSTRSFYFVGRLHSLLRLLHLRPDSVNLVFIRLIIQIYFLRMIFRTSHHLCHVLLLLFSEISLFHFFNFLIDFNLFDNLIPFVCLSLNREIYDLFTRLVVVFCLYFFYFGACCLQLVKLGRFNAIRIKVR